VGGGEVQNDEERKAFIQSEIKTLTSEFLDHFSKLPEEKQKQIIHKIQVELIYQYYQTATEVSKSKGLSKEEKLRRLLTPLIAYNAISPFGQPIIPFTHESIDISRELDIDYLNYDKKRYRIEDFEEKRPLYPGSSIFFTKKFERELQWHREKQARGENPIITLSMGSYTCLADLYKEWLPSLDQNKIISTDLLDQILVAYTIKRAQNGSEEAIQKLCDLYKGAAEALAVNFGKMFKIHQKTKALKSDVQVLLRFVISGFRPEEIITQLIGSDSEKVLRAVPPWIKNLFIYYFSEYLPQIIQKNLEDTQINESLIDRLKGFKTQEENKKKEIDELIYSFENRNQWLLFEWAALFNPYSPIQDGILWRGTPKRINRFNSYSFRPRLVKMGPRRNLTTWLLGRKGEIDILAKSEREDGTFGKAWKPYGKLYQLLRDLYKPLIKEKKRVKNFDFVDHFDEDHEETLSFKDRSRALGIKGNSAEGGEMENQIMLKEITQKIKDGLLGLRVSHGNVERDVEIYLRLVAKEPQFEVGQEYKLSTRHIRRIYQQIKELIPKLKYLWDEE
jgi:hypothetical protein